MVDADGSDGTLSFTGTQSAINTALAAESYQTQAISFGDPRHVTNQSFDLGTSTLPAPDGRRVPNDGLIQFKQSVGAAAQVRLTLQRAL